MLWACNNYHYLKIQWYLNPFTLHSCKGSVTDCSSWLPNWLGLESRKKNTYWLVYNNVSGKRLTENRKYSLGWGSLSDNGRFMKDLKERHRCRIPALEFCWWVCHSLLLSPRLTWEHSFLTISRWADDQWHPKNHPAPAWNCGDFSFVDWAVSKLSVSLACKCLLLITQPPQCKWGKPTYQKPLENMYSLLDFGSDKMLHYTFILSVPLLTEYWWIRQVCKKKKITRFLST